MPSSNDRMAVRVNVRLPDAGSAESLAADLAEWQGVWVDDEGAGSFDPGIVGFVIENLVALAGPLVAYLALRAKNGRVDIPVENEKRELILTVHPDVTEEDMAALTELLSDYGKLRSPDQ